MNKADLLSKKKEMVEFRKALRGPIYFVEMGWAEEDWLSYQKVSFVDAKEHETIAYFDTGSDVDAKEVLQFRSFRSMCIAQFKKDRNRNIQNNTVLRPEIFQQLERRLCLNPYERLSESDEESTTPRE